MKKKKNIDYNLRLLFFKNEIKYILLKHLMYNSKTTETERFFLLYLLKKLRYNKISLSKSKNYGIYSGVSRSILRKYKLSRWEFKKDASFGLIKGIQKSSW